MKFRLIEGGGEMFYKIGVKDDGTATGLNKNEMEKSLSKYRTLCLIYLQKRSAKWRGT